MIISKGKKSEMNNSKEASSVTEDGENDMNYLMTSIKSIIML